MICLRCGYCCIYLDVVIINPQFVPESGEFTDAEWEDDKIYMHKGHGVPCPHLIWNEMNQAGCKIHEMPFYKMTPCFMHGQIERNKTDSCRMGNYMHQNGRVIPMRDYCKGKESD